MSLTLKVSNISKSYGGTMVLDNCSYLFDSIDTYVLTGHNGCGKSTFLRLCSLLEQPDSGSIVFSDEGRRVEVNMDLRRRMTLVLPKVGIFNTTVAKNAAYGLRVRGRSRAEVDEMTLRALDFVGLAQKKDQNALTLSSGEAQRVGIARALVIGPDILFLDEPTASVDSRNTELIEDILLTLKSEGKSIVVIATHDKDQARRLGGRLLLMDDGRMVAD